MRTIVCSTWSLLAVALIVGCSGGGTYKMDANGSPGSTGGAGGSTVTGTGGTDAAGTGGAGGMRDPADAGASGGDSSGGAPDANADHQADAALDAIGGADAISIVDAGPPSKRQSARVLGTNGAPNGYLEYLPPGYDATTPAPLLVFWHGIGEDGNGTTELSKITAWGPPKLIANNNWDAARPFIVLSPQYTAQNGGGIAPGAGCPSSATINTFLTWALGHYRIDAKRVYLTGLSCGAIGSWDYLANFQGTVVAAAVLLSGNPGDPTQAGSAWKRAGCTLGTAAIWSLHGDADTTVPYAPDHDTVADLVACPAPPRRDAKFTDIVGGGHEIWDPIYNLSGGSGDIYAWMLAQAKP